MHPALGQPFGRRKQPIINVAGITAHTSTITFTDNQHHVLSVNFRTNSDPVHCVREKSYVHFLPFS